MDYNDSSADNNDEHPSEADKYSRYVDFNDLSSRDPKFGWQQFMQR
jgi:hypothetical protein